MTKKKRKDRKVRDNDKWILTCIGKKAFDNAAQDFLGVAMTADDRNAVALHEQPHLTIEFSGPHEIFVTEKVTMAPALVIVRSAKRQEYI